MRTEVLTKTFMTEGTIVPFRFVAGSTTRDNYVRQAAAATDPIIGIGNIPLGQDDPIKYGTTPPVIQLIAERPIDVVLLGIFPIELGATVARFGLVTSDAQGRAVALGGTPAVGTYVARVLEAGVVGNIRNCMLLQAIAA